MPRKQTEVTLLVDQTGSMYPYASQVVDGLNFYTKALTAQTPGPIFATLALFAESVTIQYRQRPLHQVDRLRLEAYDPDGQTALYDAIAALLPTATQACATTPQVFIILSDGEDVCSHISLTTCAEVIAAAQAKGVLVAFLGDGPDALETAAVLGIPAHCRYQFTAREGLHELFRVLTAQTLRALTAVAARGQLPATFFSEAP